MKTPLILATALFVASVIPGSAEPFFYRELCDASAAVALGPNHFVVAEDERNTLFIFERGKAKAVATVSLTKYLDTFSKKKDEDKEADIEAATIFDSTIYWITSHARDSGGKIDPERFRFFATEIVTIGGVPTVKPLTTPPYRDLLNDILKEKKFERLNLVAATILRPEADGGLNIEGLAATPDGQLLIGFRNPRPAGFPDINPGVKINALIIPLKNPAALLAGGKPEFGDFILLDLNGRGIRSIEYIGGRYLIIAGPHESETKSVGFSLYTWDGKQSKPEPITTVEPDLQTIRPEAMFPTSNPNEIQLLSDDGDEPVPGFKTCKHKNTPNDKKSFRSIMLVLPR